MSSNVHNASKDIYGACEQFLSTYVAPLQVEKKICVDSSKHFTRFTLSLKKNSETDLE